MDEESETVQLYNGQGDVKGLYRETQKRKRHHSTILTSVTRNAFCQMF